MDQNSWKTLVSLDYLGMTNQRESNDTKASKQRDKMKEFLRGCCDEIKMDVGAGEKEHVFWERKAVRSVDDYRSPRNHMGDL